MGHADTAGAGRRQSPVTLLIVGGGIMGLWAAVKAGRAGIDTLLIDGSGVASGASGGILGALMPHMPDRWSAKKQFQFDALLSLEEEIAALEAETGLDAGYRRCGRLIPLPKPHLVDIALGHQRDADIHWRQGSRSFAWNVITAPLEAGWPVVETGQPLVHDTFAARVSPRGLTAALRRSAERLANVSIMEGTDVVGFDTAGSAALLSDGERIAYGHCIVAAGHRSFDLLASLGPDLPRPLGQAVKGQAALLRAAINPDLPLVFLDGLYIVPHGDGTVAIGSTSENSFDQPFDTDSQLEDLTARARALVPSLHDADVIARWAGLRPKAIERDPMVGPHPEHGNVLALTGGFKVSFGLAHRLAEAVLAPLTGASISLPPGFDMAHHLASASRQR
ncbi:FAD-binding oxidoreductase [Rhizobium sp. RU36D]|uniref:NAD(P)/FAD-dependent oxidoreductase n=1 Tax=Rhizobium sp. RU36D TaxID=1907415 RepID=UPI0009FD8FB5|nr:FAD-binding oxidoreductase [Rhizobium sp. RU36D]